MPGTKGQHYITENYQRNFADKQGRVWFLDDQDKIFRTNPENTFKEKHFYTVKFPSFPDPLVVEKTLAQMEGEFARVVAEKINKQKPLDANDRVAISLFASAMFLRGKPQREGIKKFFKETLGSLKAIKSDPKLVEFYKSLPSQPEDDSISMSELESGVENFDSFHSLAVMDNMLDIAPIIFDMKWSLLIAPSGKSFISSDRPLNMVSPEREKKYGPKAIGSLAGLAHQDTELTFPISSQVTLLASWKYEELGYIEATEKQLEQLNYRIIRSSKRLFANKREILGHILEVDKMKGTKP